MNRRITLRRVKWYCVPLIVTRYITRSLLLKLVTTVGCLWLPVVMPQPHRGMLVTRYEASGEALALRLRDAARYAVPSNATPFCFAFHAAVTNAI